MIKKLIGFLFLINAVILFVGWSPHSASHLTTRVPAPGSVKSESFNTGDTLTLHMPAIELLSDRVVVASGYAGFDTTYRLSADPDSVWVPCPIIEDDDIEWDEQNWWGPRPKRIVIFVTPYNENRARAMGAAWGYYLFIVGPIYGPSTSPHGEGGFYVRRKNGIHEIPGFFWIVLKIKEPS